jgi:high-affinity K+ transport system ATPase subunit B
MIAVVQGTWMLCDGIHALKSGSYFGSRLGPWATVVAQAGIDPCSTAMKYTFVSLGIVWLTVAALLTLRTAHALVLAIVAGVVTLWFLPFGTLLSAIVIAGAATQLTKRT